MVTVLIELPLKLDWWWSQLEMFGVPRIERRKKEIGQLVEQEGGPASPSNAAARVQGISWRHRHLQCVAWVDKPQRIFASSSLSGATQNSVFIFIFLKRVCTNLGVGFNKIKQIYFLRNSNGDIFFSIADKLSSITDHYVWQDLGIGTFLASAWRGRPGPASSDRAREKHAGPAECARQRSETKASWRAKGDPIQGFF